MGPVCVTPRTSARPLRRRSTLTSCSAWRQRRSSASHRDAAGTHLRVWGTRMCGGRTQAMVLSAPVDSVPQTRSMYQQHHSLPQDLDSAPRGVVPEPGTRHRSSLVLSRPSSSPIIPVQDRPCGRSDRPYPGSRDRTVKMKIPVCSHLGLAYPPASASVKRKKAYLRYHGRICLHTSGIVTD